ncbi:MAG: tyrosine-type recombinase/integrase [Limisphaerales bacterium]
MAWLYQRDGSTKWWIGYRMNGRQFLRSTKTSDRKAAERQLAKLEQVALAHAAGNLTDEYVRLLTSKQSSGESLRAYIRQWLAECKDLSEQTLKKYRSIPEELCIYLRATDDAPLLREIQPDTVGSFLREKRANTTTANTKQVRRVLSAFFNYAVDNQALAVSPVPSVRSLKLNKDRKTARRAFTVMELKTIYEKCPNDFWRYMVMAGFFTGQRMGDLVCLPWGAVDLDGGKIRLTQRKTGKAIVLPLRNELATLIAELKAEAGAVKPAEAIFPDQCARYQKFGSGVFSNEFYDDVLLPAGLVTKRTHAAIDRDGAATGQRKASAVSFHCLRHTFVSLLKVTGATQATAKELAGHSTDAISDLYTHVPEAELNRAIKKLPEVTK